MILLGKKGIYFVESGFNLQLDIVERVVMVGRDLGLLLLSEVENVDFEIGVKFFGSWGFLMVEVGGVFK